MFTAEEYHPLGYAKSVVVVFPRFNEVHEPIGIPHDAPALFEIRWVAFALGAAHELFHCPLAELALLMLFVESLEFA